MPATPAPTPAAPAAGGDARSWAVDLVIVHRGQPDRVTETVRRFRAQAVPVRVLVVDNGSSAADRARLRLPGVTLLELGENRGFGPAANAGFRWFLDGDSGPGAPWLAVAPHDAHPAPDCLARLLEELLFRSKRSTESRFVI